MSDLFHEDVPREFIAAVWFVLSMAKQHTGQVLTKRPQRALDILTDPGFPALMVEAGALVDDNTCQLISFFGAGQKPREDLLPLPNVWLGVSAENQQAFDERVTLLRQIPAALHFASLEPLLGPIDASRHMWPVHDRWPAKYETPEEARADGAEVTRHRQALVSAHANFLRWVIVGGETGPGARPMHPDWARSLRDQCVEAKVPFFFKGWGEWRPQFTAISLGAPKPPRHQWPNKSWSERVGKKVAGRELDGRTWEEFPK